MLLNFLTLSDKSVYRRVKIGGGRMNVRHLPLVDQFLDTAVLHRRANDRIMELAVQRER